MKESDIMRLIQIEASRQGCRLFRFSVGLFYTKFGTPVKVGHVGVSDLVGFKPVTITQDMVGKTVCVFTACEVKTPIGRLSEEQRSFLDAVNTAGGLAFCCRSVAEFVDKLNDSK